ncbi:DUF262 domain-containing protein [Amycolatopsis sp. CA-161197]|uniref:DUF262 domain-containing protein n=1 Tax=Amycolatopsis sp. CA-161197 TaxID=3239922 RepID=UPI003D8E8BEC
MRFEPKDPDIATIVRRIEQQIYDLQPDFQRGEVWSTNKKQRLIDSIMRRWHVPPIHLVATEEGTYDVLDGQQRLTAIRDFVNGKFPIDGTVEPYDEEMAQLSGLRYGELPPKVRNQFDNFSIRVFQLDQYEPQEPYELFFRLNQPTNLTEAEKRNAFVGGPRNQVKDLVEWAIKTGMTPSRIGFSNARMSYDDLLARFLLTIDQSTLLEKVTSARITARYREGTPFPEPVLTRAKESLTHLLAVPFLQEGLKPNKATIHTWLCMCAKLQRYGLLESHGHALIDSIRYIEHSRIVKTAAEPDKDIWPALQVFHDRSTSRVADTSSVMLRDLVAWLVLGLKFAGLQPEISFIAKATEALRAAKKNGVQPDRALSDWGNTEGWGGPAWL